LTRGLKSGLIREKIFIKTQYLDKRRMERVKAVKIASRDNPPHAHENARTLELQTKDYRFHIFPDLKISKFSYFLCQP
jgi:hypothetical protein